MGAHRWRPKRSLPGRVMNGRSGLACQGSRLLDQAVVTRVAIESVHVVAGDRIEGVTAAQPRCPTVDCVSQREGSKEIGCRGEFAEDVRGRLRHDYPPSVSPGPILLRANGELRRISDGAILPQAPRPLGIWPFGAAKGRWRGQAPKVYIKNWHEREDQDRVKAAPIGWGDPRNPCTPLPPDPTTILTRHGRDFSTYSTRIPATRSKACTPLPGNCLRRDRPPSCAAWTLQIAKTGSLTSF